MMAGTGKQIQYGTGNLKPSQRKAEKAGRRSTKRANERRWRRDEGRS